MNEQMLNIQFVQEIEKYPCLYNYKLPEYSRKDITERAWSAVGKIFNLTETQCKEKWKNLRAVFVRNMKPAPSGSSSKKKKPYYLTDAMQFTIPYIKTLNTKISGNLPQEGFNEVIEQEDNGEENESQSILANEPQSTLTNFTVPQAFSSNLQNIPPSPMSCPSPRPTAHSIDIASTSSNLENIPPSPMSCSSLRPTAHSIDICSKDRRKGKQCSAVDEGIIDYFKARTAKLKKKTEDTVEDPNRMFLLSLQSDMNKMSDSQVRTFKRRVLSLVDEIFEESASPTVSQQIVTPVYYSETQEVPIEHNRLLRYYESVPVLINKNSDDEM